GDVTVYLLNAARMLEGQAIYKDFFQYTTPGTELVYFVLFRLFGPRAWIPNAMLFALGLSVTWLSIAISRKLVLGWLPFLSALLTAEAYLLGAFLAPVVSAYAYFVWRAAV